MKFILRIWALLVALLKKQQDEKDFVYFDNPNCVGYGPVNFWWQMDHEEVIREMAKNGLDVYHIELLGWADTRIMPEQVGDPYRRLLKECRKHKIALFVSAFNDNARFKKYGNRPWNPSLELLHMALNIIIAEGPEGVIVQPVAETGSDYGKRFENEALVRLSESGFRTCYNRGSRPTKVPEGWTYAAYHPRSIAESIPAGTVCVTDTGSVLRERYARELGGYEQFNVDALYGHAKRVLKSGNPFVAYGFLHSEFDSGAVEKLGRVKREVSNE
jgi:hypothetical protein